MPESGDFKTSDRTFPPMAPWIVVAGAGAGVFALAGVFVVFLLPIPAALAIVLYAVFGIVFVMSAAIFGRLLVMED